MQQKALLSLISVVFRDINIMNNMVAMLEKYSGNIEDIVSERTKQLMDEKKKTDTLLYQMLPKYSDYLSRLILPY